jgi:hypothetical protein
MYVQLMYCKAVTPCNVYAYAYGMVGAGGAHSMPGGG